MSKFAEMDIIDEYVDGRIEKKRWRVQYNGSMRVSYDDGATWSTVFVLLNDGAILDGDGSPTPELGVLSTKECGGFRNPYLNELPPLDLPSREQLQRCIDNGERPYVLAKGLGISIPYLYAYLRGER